MTKTFEINVQLLPYVDSLELRDVRSVDLVVVHCTELPDLATAREYGERVQDSLRSTGFSGHYYVDRDGASYCYVPLDRIAHHTRGYNARSVGIELVNCGRFPDWFDSRRQVMSEPYPKVQIDALTNLLRGLKSELPNLEHIAGHEELDRGKVAASDAPGLEVFRKRDPGTLFPWAEVLESCGLKRMTDDSD